jgi:hypothetical protein
MDIPILRVILKRKDYYNTVDNDMVVSAYLKRLSAANVRNSVAEPKEWPAITVMLKSITPCK